MTMQLAPQVDITPKRQGHWFVLVPTAGRRKSMEFVCSSDAATRAITVRCLDSDSVYKLCPVTGDYNLRSTLKDKQGRTVAHLRLRVKSDLGPEVVEGWQVAGLALQTGSLALFDREVIAAVAAAATVESTGTALPVFGDK